MNTENSGSPRVPSVTSTLEGEWFKRILEEVQGVGKKIDSLAHIVHTGGRESHAYRIDQFQDQLAAFAEREARHHEQITRLFEAATEQQRLTVEAQAAATRQWMDTLQGMAAERARDAEREAAREARIKRLEESADDPKTAAVDRAKADKRETEREARIKRLEESAAEERDERRWLRRTVIASLIGGTGTGVLALLWLGWQALNAAAGAAP